MYVSLPVMGTKRIVRIVLQYKRLFTAPPNLHWHDMNKAHTKPASAMTALQALSVLHGQY